MNIEPIERAGIGMVVAGVPAKLVIRAIEAAEHDEGIAELFHLWLEQDTPEDRDACVADIAELLEDAEPALGGVPEGVEEADASVERLLAYKENVRALVERAGGVTEVARRAGMAQPSLSRFLNTASRPRRDTVVRLARALGLPRRRLMPPGSQREGEVILLAKFQPGPVSATRDAVEGQQLYEVAP